MKKQIIPLMMAGLLCGCGGEPAAVPPVWDSANPDTAEKLTYTVYGEAAMTYETEDSALIADCIAALKEMTVGAKTDVRYADAGEVLRFQFADGGVYQITFKHGNFIAGDTAYETEGRGAVSAVLRKIGDTEA